MDAAPAWLAWLIGAVPGMLLAWVVLGLGPWLRLIGSGLLAAVLAGLAWWLGAQVRLARIGLPRVREVTAPRIPEADDAAGDETGDAEPEPSAPPPRDDPLLEMVPLAGGRFWMGSAPSRDPDSFGSERPRHEVRVSPFLIARTPV